MDKKWVENLLMALYFSSPLMMSIIFFSSICFLPVQTLLFKFTWVYSFGIDS